MCESSQLGTTLCLFNTLLMNGSQVASSIHSIALAGGRFDNIEQVNDYLTLEMFKDFIWGRYFRYGS